jgi:hypothetical protein
MRLRAWPVTRGSFFFAYRITKIFGWPCRLTSSADIGVDAEIEIIDTTNSSSGDLLKAQVKTMSVAPSGNPFSVSVDDEHVLYWKRLCLPLIFCAVTLDDEKIYWRVITSAETYETSGESKKVTFDRNKHVLDAASKDKLLELVPPVDSKLIDEMMRAVERRLAAFDNVETVDLAIVEQWHEEWKALHAMLEAIKVLHLNFRWRNGALGDQWIARLARGIAQVRVKVDIARNASYS